MSDVKDNTKSKIISFISNQNLESQDAHQWYTSPTGEILGTVTTTSPNRLDHLIASFFRVSPERNCSTCSSRLNIGLFHAKGKRRDSRCRECTSRAKAKGRKMKMRSKARNVRNPLFYSADNMQVCFEGVPDLICLAQELKKALQE